MTPPKPTIGGERSTQAGYTRTVGSDTVCALRVRLPARLDASARGREAIRRFGRPESIPGDTMLVASELVSYALTRADPTDAEPIELRLDLEDTRAVIAVSWTADPRAREPELARARGDLYERLGLHIVGVLAERHEILAGGAWAELACPSPGGE